jgi:glycosyltransferase involved in cell wall biosynthesis
VLQNNPTFRTVYPNKVFDYMATARPTLLAIDGIARKLVCDDAQAGVFATPEDPQALAASIRWLSEHREECEAMGERGRRWVEAHAGREALATRYLKILEVMVSDTAST